MPQIVEPTEPEAQREIIRLAAGRNRHRNRNRSARRSFGFPGLSDSAELWRISSHDGMSARSVRRRLVTCISHRLSDHRATIGRRSTARTAITLRRREWDNGCHRSDGRHGERGVTVASRRETKIAHRRRSFASHSMRSLSSWNTFCETQTGFAWEPPPHYRRAGSDNREEQPCQTIWPHGAFTKGSPFAA